MNTPPLPQVGDTLADKYVIEEVLGEGGMGLVYRAMHRELLHRVAIKVLLPHVAGHATAAERFRREARAAAHMRGDHVCRVLDFGTLDNVLPFIVMEYLEGQDLAAELLEHGPLVSTEAVDLVLQACEALAEAHGAGIVHRDLKPANLFLATNADGSSKIKVLDFGVSKALAGNSDLGLTNTSTMVGSPLYMSPEQLDSARDVDARTDIWALGIVLYELICGCTPFTGTSIPQLVSAVLHETPEPMEARGARAPHGLELVIGKALSKEREHRFASIADFAEALMPFGSAASRHSALRTARVLSASLGGIGAREPSGVQRPTQPQTEGGAYSASRTPGEGTPLSWPRNPSGVQSESGPQQRKKSLVWLLIAVGAAAAVGTLVMLRSGAGDAMTDTEPPPSAPPQTRPVDLEARPAELQALETEPATAGMLPQAPPEVEPLRAGSSPTGLPKGLEPESDLGNPVAPQTVTTVPKAEPSDPSASGVQAVAQGADDEPAVGVAKNKTQDVTSSGASHSKPERVKPATRSLSSRGQAKRDAPTASQDTAEDAPAATGSISDFGGRR